MDKMSKDTFGYGRASGPAGRPAHFVAGVIHDRSEFDRALDEIVALGIDRDSLGVLYGERGAAAIAHRPRHWLREFLSDESRYVERYEEEIREGGLVVGVPLDKPESQRDRVREILRAHGAHYIVSSTPWTFAIDD